MSFKHMTESQRKEICDYMLSRSVDHETIHCVCVFMDKYVSEYHKDIQELNKQVVFLEKRIDSVRLIVSQNDLTTFSESKSNW